MTAQTRKSPLSLRQRLTFITGFSTFILLLFTWLLVTWGSHHYAQQRAYSLLKAVSSELLDEMEPHLSAAADFPEMVEEIREASRHTSETLEVLHLRAGRVQARSHSHNPPWPVPDKSDWLIAVIPYHGDQLVAALYYGEVQSRLDQQALVLAVLCLLLFVLIGLGTWSLVSKVLAPIGLLSRQARDAESDFQTRLASPSKDAEITELVDTLNQFLSRLLQSTELRSRFYAAASHELRTPLQALSGHLELALNKERSAQEYRVALGEAQTQSQRLIRLTQDLLTLNQLEVDSQASPQRLDFAEHCEIEWQLQKSAALDKGLRLSLSLPDESWVLAQASYLSIICRNLFENAVKYCPEGGMLSVKLEGTKLTVFNHCKSLDSADFDKLLEPFFRPDPSRHSTTGGNGLGLAIVHTVAQSQKWELRIWQAEGGFWAEISLPASA